MKQFNTNRIFETMLYNLFLSDEELKRNAFSREGELARSSSSSIWTTGT